MSPLDPRADESFHRISRPRPEKLCPGSERPVEDGCCPVCGAQQGIRSYTLPHYRDAEPG